MTVFLGTAAPAGGTTITLSLGTGTATETTDFTLSTKSLTIDEGDQFATLTLTAVDDTVDDDAETVVLNAASSSPAYTATQTVTIIDNDPAAPMSAPSGLAAAAGPGTANGDLGRGALVGDDGLSRLRSNPDLAQEGLWPERTDGWASRRERSAARRPEAWC